MQENTYRPEPAPRDDSGRYKEGKGKSRVICTQLLQSGELDLHLWRCDILFTEKRISPTTVRGHHFWAIPYVRLMQNHPWAVRLISPLATWRAQEIAYQLGKSLRPHYRGKIVRLLGETICWLIGCVVSQRDWRALYSNSLKTRS